MIFFIPNPEVRKIFDSASIYSFWHLQCCSCKHQILGIENILNFLEIIYHCLEILLPCSNCTVQFVSSEWTTFTSHITIIGKLFGLILPEDCYPQRFDSLKLHMVVLQLLILIYLTVVKFFQSSPLSPLPKYLNYFSQCQANHHHSNTSQYHYWNHVPTLSPSSSHTWQTFLSHTLLFYLNSNFFLSCIGFLFATE